MRILIAAGIVLATVASSSAQVGSLFSDPTAAGVGDVLTVIIQESTSATNQTATSTSKSNEIDIESTISGAGNILKFIPLHTLESDAQNEYDGRGSTSRSARLTTRMSVNVIGTKPNGDLLVEGARTMKINGETEGIHLSGSVPLIAIRSDNTVLSSNIGDLNIEYTGKGTITQGARPGVLARLINWIL